MSAAGHAHAAHDEHDDELDDHDDHDAHAEPPPDEPETPGWLPLLGGALFLAALLFFLATRAPEPAGDDAAAPTDTAQEAGAEAGEAAPAD